ncbi:MAG TPA: ABC transporter permease [Chitinophagaceae bacterium]|nr:ABC transporter permease [Chitinophagaceae bacterium]
MHKIWLIIKREYLTRVRKRTFIIATLLLPIFYMAMIFGTGYLADTTRHNLKVAFADSSGFFTDTLLNRENVADHSSTLTLLGKNSTINVSNFDSAGYQAYVFIPAIKWDGQESTQVFLQTKKAIGEISTQVVAAKINRIWDEVKNEKLGIDISKRMILTGNRIELSSQNVNDAKSDARTASGLAMACAFLIYFIILLYGNQVMTGVMEEKTSRIAEIIVSSVKPFQMMLGKIIGIGMVALTQFLLWIAFIFLLYNITKASGNMNSASNLVGSVQKIFTSVDFPLVLFFFGFYFLGGFFFYSSIYGAIGSAINEDVREAQSLAFPVTMLVIFSILLMTPVVNDPSSPLAVWASIIPFSSPIIMMARIPFGIPGTVPWWQLALSMGMLILGFMFTTWFASKIYRTGILMYGKKASWKEMIRWAFRKS